GWFEGECKAYGIPFYTVGQRARRLGESVEVLTKLFTQPRTTFKGKYYTLDDAPCEPKAVQKPHPPILVGGMGPKLVQPVAAGYAQTWLCSGRAGDAERGKEVCGGFDKISHEGGGDPGEGEKAPSRGGGELGGSAEERRAKVRALADIGVRHIVVQLSPPF